MKKLSVFLILVLCVALILCSAGCGAEPAGDSSPAPSGSDVETVEPVTTPEPDAKEALKDALDGALFYESVNNDATGRWRLLVYASSENFVDHAADYYNAFFASDDEVHIAVNLTLKATIVMNVSGGLMSLDVHEYIDGEEHDAKILGGGDLLKQYTIDLETGEISDLSTASVGSVNLEALASDILAALPEVCQGSRWNDVSCEAVEDGLIYVMMQVDQGSDDKDSALALAAECYATAKGIMDDNDVSLSSISATVVNNGSALGIYSTDNGNDFTVISDGKMTEVSLP